MKKQTSALIIASLFISLLFNSAVVFAAEPVQHGFNPNKLIDDKVFSNSSAYGSAEDIQKFLDSKGSVLANTSNAFISQLREPSEESLKNILEDPHPNLTKKRSAAELIFDAAKSSGINPQVILVTLNKEQSLITGRQNATPEQLQRALDFSLGFGCPDSQPCGSIYKGFYFQLFGGVDAENNRYLGAAKSLMKSFSTSGGRGPYYNGAISKVGDTITLPNTVGNYEGVEANQSVTLSNAATAALYRYTPHVYNGNYNFWRFFTAWFGKGTASADGHDSNLIKSSTSGDVYIIEGGRRYIVFPFIAKARNIKLSKAKKVSKATLASYPDGGVYAAPDNTLVKLDGKYYIFTGNKKKEISETEIKAKGLKTSKAIKVKQDELTQFNTASEEVVVAPNPTPNPAPAPTPAPTPAPQTGLVAGGIYKTATDPTVYLYEDGVKKPMDGEIFRNRGFSFANISVVSQSVLDAVNKGSFPMPVNETYFQDKNGQLYIYRGGKKVAVSKFVATQRQMTPDFTFGEDLVNAIPSGVPILPKEGTILKGDKKADVYVVNANLIFPMTYSAFVARGITVAQVNIVPQAEIDSYSKGSLLTK